MKDVAEGAKYARKVIERQLKVDQMNYGIVMSNLDDQKARLERRLQ